MPLVSAGRARRARHRRPQCRRRWAFADLPNAVGVVQCKAWATRQVGVAQVRELLGVMAHESVRRGYFAATGDFTPAAIDFATANPIKLITGRDFLEAIARMP
jgi:restriction system protein